MKLQKFTLNGEEYSFSETIRNHFLKLVEVTKNFRVAQGAWIDLRELANLLVNRLEEISDEDISPEKKEEGLKGYFADSSFSVIKAAFIKNTHKEKVYFEHQEEYKNHLRSGLKKGFSIKDEYLAKTSSIKLSMWDNCVGAVLTLPESMELYLKGENLYNEKFLNEIVIDFIFIPGISEKLNDCSDDKIRQNEDAIRRSFFNYFEFIKSAADFRERCLKFIEYKVVVLKFSFELDEEENKLITVEEEKLTKEKIAAQVHSYNMLPSNGHFSELLSKIDPDKKYLKKLAEQYPLYTE